MSEPRMIDDLARRLAGSLPEGLQSLRDELEQNFRPVLQSALSRLDLVTREEFDVQTAVLARAREQLDALSAKIDALQERLDRDAEV